MSSKEDALPGTARLYESGGYIDGMVNPFESLPFPNTITVGLADEDYPREGDEVAHIMEIRRDGTAAIYQDPLGHPVCVFNPEDVAIFEFLVAHFNHYATEWKERPLEERQQLMSSFPKDRDFVSDESVARSEHAKKPKPAWWWAGMHSDALHPGDRKDCEHCRLMIANFGPMPPKEEIEKAYIDNLNLEVGQGPSIREIVLTPPSPQARESREDARKGSSKRQPELDKDWLNK